MILLSIIILTYDTEDLTLNCIQSIVNNYRKELQDGLFEIIVVDNASKDGTVEKISNFKFQISNLRIIQNKENYGFSKGNNIAAKTADGKYILFLNSDTKVKDRNFLDMIKFLEKNLHIGILGGRLINKDGSPQLSAGRFYNVFNLFLMLMGGERLGLVRQNPVEITKIDWVSGACLMIRTDVFRKIKGFDENLFMYMDDVELCFRARKFGFDTYFYPNLKLIHEERGSSNKTFAILNIYKGISYFYKKHGNFLSYSVIKSMLYLKAFLLAIIGRIIKNRYLSDTYSKALKI